MKKVFFTIVLTSLNILLVAQSHRYTETLGFTTMEAGKKVQRAEEGLQVTVSTESPTTFRFQIFIGNSRTSTYDFKYRYEDSDGGYYFYKCINCGRGEQSHIGSKHRLSHFANGRKGSLMLFITDYMGDYRMILDLNR